MANEEITAAELERDAAGAIKLAEEEVENLPPPEQPPPIIPFDTAKEDVSPPLRFVPDNRVEDPEALTTEQIRRIPTGTVLFRDIATGVGRRMYIKLPSGLRFVALT